MNNTELHNTNSTLIKNIYDFLQNGDKLIKYSPNKDIVLLLGNTGSGKSTLTHYISGNDHMLLSQEVEEGIGEYVIVDQQNKISSTSTIVSQTIYPDLVEDAKTNTLYYDCPGFSDTRSAAHEIAATYFIKKVVDSARAVKMVFVVSHHSVTRGADRQDFILMLQHATDFIKQMEKFKTSIALIVTKIENRYVGGKMVPDEKVIKTIGHYLEQVKQDIYQHPQMVTSTVKSSDTKEKVLSLLDIFLSKDGNEQYTRIGIFRKPNEAGRISDIELMKQGKAPLGNLISKNIQFVKPAIKDFGYTISAKSKIHISGLAEEINKTIVKELFNIGKEVRDYCVSQEEKASDIDDLIHRFKKLLELFSKIQDNAIKDAITPDVLISEIETTLKQFKITISDNHIKTVQREEDYINFLNLVSNESIKGHKSSLLAAGLSNLTEYLSDSHSFYSILNSMYKRLSEYDIQKNRNKYNTTLLNEYNDLFQSPIFREIETIFKDYSNMKEMKPDTAKLNLLNRVLAQLLKHEIEVISPDIDKIVVKGLNVILSDIRELFSNKNIKFIEIYALHKVFIDISLDLTGREIQMAIVAPVWEVVGSPRIILDGKPGMDHYPHKARSGIEYGERGFDGQPGEPGGPAGNFIGIGKHYLNEEYLHISANGGDGGRGQDGGDGAEGYDGAHCPIGCTEKIAFLITLIYNKDDKEYIGGKGGHGGNGGIGGHGGNKGIINLLKVGTEAGIVQAKQIALDGHQGGIGIGGNKGKGGRYFQKKVTNYVGIVHKSIFEPIDKWGADGESGYDGANLEGMKNTWKLTKLINPSDTISEYKNYLQNNTGNSIQKTFLMTFLDEIDNNQTLVTQPMNREKRNTKNFIGIPNSEDKQRTTNMHKDDPIEMQWQSYDRYVGEGKDNYYLDPYRHLYGISNPVSDDFFIKSENTKQIPSKTTFPMLTQLENIRTQKYINLNDQHSPMDLHGNILLSEMVLKKFMGKETSSNNVNKQSSEERVGSAHDLAYRHYLGLQ